MLHIFQRVFFWKIWTWFQIWEFSVKANFKIDEAFTKIPISFIIAHTFVFDKIYLLLGRGYKKSKRPYSHPTKTICNDNERIIKDLNMEEIVRLTLKSRMFEARGGRYHATRRDLVCYRSKWKWFDCVVWRCLRVNGQSQTGAAGRVHYSTLLCCSYMLSALFPDHFIRYLMCRSSRCQQKPQAVAQLHFRRLNHRDFQAIDGFFCPAL